MALRGRGRLGLARLAYQGWQLRRATRHLAQAPQAGYLLAYTGGQLPTNSFGTPVFWDETAGLTAAEAAMVVAGAGPGAPAPATATTCAG